MIYNHAGIPIRDVLILALLSKPPQTPFAETRTKAGDLVLPAVEDNGPFAPHRRRFTVGVGPRLPSPALIPPWSPRLINTNRNGEPFKAVIDRKTGKSVEHRPIVARRGVDRAIAKSMQRGYRGHRNPTIPKLWRPARAAARIAAAEAATQAVLREAA